MSSKKQQLVPANKKPQKVQPIQTLALVFDDTPSAFENELQNALAQIATVTQLVDTAITEEVGDMEAYMDSDIYKQTIASASTKKATGTFSMLGTIIQANEYTKYDGILKKNVRSFMVTMRLTKSSISEQELNRINGRFVDDIYGGYFEIPVHCNLSQQKFKDYLAEKQLIDSNMAAAELAAAAVSSSSSSSTNSKRSGSDLQSDADAPLTKKQKLDNGKSKKSGSKTEPMVEDPESEITGKELVPATNNGTLTQYFKEKSNSTHRCSPNGTPIYEADELDGKAFLGQDVIVLMRLHANQEVTFDVNEKTMTSDPTPWTVILADIKANPYIADNIYSVMRWTICSFVLKQKIAVSDMYKYFEMVSQTSPVFTRLYQYLEETKDLPKETFSKGEKKKSTPLENASLTWFVCGNEINASKPLQMTDDGYHVWYCLNRNRKPEQFKKIDASTKGQADKMVGQIPYQFDVYQWKGSFNASNPTLYRCAVEIIVNWKHICPSALTCENYKPKADNSLGINSITAWVCLICANYPHIKIAINAKESFSMNASIKLNLDRYAQGKLKHDGYYMMRPHEVSTDRLMLPLFRKIMFMQRSILLPFETIKSCGIPVTQAYIFNHAWKDKCPPQSTPGVSELDATPLRPVDLNNSVHCLSESQTTEQFFSEDVNKENNRYNFYAITNVCYKQVGQQDTSALNMLTNLPKTTGEGIVYLEALRHIFCNGALKGCYKTERGQFPDFGNVSNSEKYVQYLQSINGLPATSPLFKIRLDDLQVFHQDSKLVVYFYAVSKTVDDPADQKGKCLVDLRSGLSHDLVKVLTNREAENDETSSRHEGNGEEEDDDEGAETEPKTVAQNQEEEEWVEGNTQKPEEAASDSSMHKLMATGDDDDDKNANNDEGGDEEDEDEEEDG